MDWIRLKSSGKDLVKNGKGKPIKIDEKLLSKHNKIDDAWLMIKGKN